MGWHLIRTTAVLLVLAGCAQTQRIDPDASEKRYLLGADLFGKGAVRPALEELLKAVELNPENAEAQNLLGIVFLRQASEGEDMIERANCLSGEEAKLGLTEVDQKYREAEARFLKATTLRATFSEAWNNLAVVHLHFQRWDDAIAATTKALSNLVYVDTWAAQGNLGWAWYQKGDLVRSTKELRSAVYANPRFCVGRYRLARVYYEQQNFDGAREELMRLTADPACPIQEAYHLMGLVGLKQGSPASRALASEAFRRCVELAPRSCLAKKCRIEN